MSDDDVKPLPFAELTLRAAQNIFQARCDGERLEARVNDGPWEWVCVPVDFDGVDNAMLPEQTSLTGHEPISMMIERSSEWLAGYEVGYKDGASSALDDIDRILDTVVDIDGDNATLFAIRMYLEARRK